MRQPRDLKNERQYYIDVDDDSEQRVRFVTERVTQWLAQSLPEDQRAIIRDYVNKYGTDWWRQLDLDTGGMLGDEFRKFGYTESFLGKHELQPFFKKILEQAVTT